MGEWAYQWGDVIKTIGPIMDGSEQTIGFEYYNDSESLPDAEVIYSPSGLDRAYIDLLPADEAPSNSEANIYYDEAPIYRETILGEKILGQAVRYRIYFDPWSDLDWFGN